MIKPLFHGTVKAGKLHIEHRKDFDFYLCSLEGKAVDLTVEKKRVKRSDQQNRYLWGVVYEVIARQCGYTTEQIHDLLRYKFLKVEDGRTPGMYTITSTTKLTKDEFSEYIEQIRAWASEFLGCYIPEAGEVEP
jgi:NinB protein